MCYIFNQKTCDILLVGCWEACQWLRQVSVHSPDSRSAADGTLGLTSRVYFNGVVSQWLAPSGGAHQSDAIFQHDKFDVISNYLLPVIRKPQGC